MQSAISTPAAPAGGDASACTTALLTPSERQKIITIHSALFLGRQLSIVAHKTGLISRAELDAHAEAFTDAERALGRER